MTEEHDKIRIVIADDHPIFRSGLRRALEAREELEVVGEAATGAAALEVIESVAPDVALLDLRMPEMSGLEVLHRLKEEGRDVQVIVLTSVVEAGSAHEAIAAGAAGYLAKDAGGREICDAIVAARAGEVTVARQLHSAMFSRLRQGGGMDQTPLSPREVEILRLIADGKTNARIAEELYLSAGTVKTYLQRACSKLDRPTGASAAAEAVRRGLLS